VNLSTVTTVRAPKRLGEEQRENRREENGFSRPALHHRHHHLQV